MNESIDQAIIDLYDEAVRAHGEDAVKTAEAKAEIQQQVIELLADTERDLTREAQWATDRAVGPTRQRRSRSLRTQLGYLLDGLPDGSGDDGAYIDPLLSQAFPLGDAAGMDKELRYWKTDDFTSVVTTRYRNAAETTAAVSELDQATQRIIEKMRAAGVDVIGQVKWARS